MLLPQSYQYPYLSEGADRVDGQLRGDKEYALLQWRNQFWQSLEEGAGKRCSECAAEALSNSKQPLLAPFSVTAGYIKASPSSTQRLLAYPPFSVTAGYIKASPSYHAETTGLPSFRLCYSIDPVRRLLACPPFSATVGYIKASPRCTRIALSCSPFVSATFGYTSCGASAVPASDNNFWPALLLSLIQLATSYPVPSSDQWPAHFSSYATAGYVPQGSEYRLALHSASLPHLVTS